MEHRISLQLILSSVVRAGNRWTKVCIESVSDENVERYKYFLERKEMKVSKAVSKI